MPEAERGVLVAALMTDWRTAKLPPADLALCAFAEKLTLAPALIAAAELAALRAWCLDDRAISNAHPRRRLLQRHRPRRRRAARRP